MAGLFGTNQQAPQLRQTELRPAGVSGATALRPVVRQSGGNLDALANALGSLNSAIGNFAATRHKVQEDPNSELNQREIAKMQQMSLDELMAQDDIEARSRPQRDAFRVILGERGFADAVPELETFFATEFDRTQDASATYDQKLAEFAERLPDEIARGRFYELMQPHKQRIIGTLAKEQIETAKQEVGTTLVSSWRTQISERRKAGDKFDPKAVAGEIFEAATASEKFLLMSPQEQTRTVFALAQQLALDGEVDIAEAILKSPRKGADGSALAAISDIPEFGAEAARLIETAKTRRQKLAVDGNAELVTKTLLSVEDGTFTLEKEGKELLELGLYDDAQVGRMAAQAEIARKTAASKAGMLRASQEQTNTALAEAEQLLNRPGGAARIRDRKVLTPSGGERTFTAKEQIETIRQGVEERFAQEEKELVEQGMDPAQAAKLVGDRREGWYINRNVANEQWEKEFTSLPATTTPIALEKNPAVKSHALTVTERYFNLRAKSAAYADTLVDEESRDFFERYSIMREAGRSPEEALMGASTLTSTPHSMRPGVGKLKVEDRKKLVTGALKKVSATKGLVANNLIETQIDRMLQSGINPTPEALGQWLEERTVLVGGTPVPVQKNMQGTFPVLAERHLTNLLEHPAVKGRGIESIEELAIQPAHDGNSWTVVEADTGLPLGMGNLTEETLSGLYDEWKAEEKAELAKKTADADADAAERKRAFEERLKWYNQRIGDRPRHGALGKRTRDSLIEERDNFVRANDPELAAAHQAKMDAEQRLSARMFARRMGYADPFPGDGALPPDDYQ